MAVCLYAPVLRSRLMTSAACTALHCSLAPVAAVRTWAGLNPPPSHPIPTHHHHHHYTRRRWSRLYAPRRRRRCISSLPSASLPVLSIYISMVDARNACTSCWCLQSALQPPTPPQRAVFSAPQQQRRRGNSTVCITPLVSSHTTTAPPHSMHLHHSDAAGKPNLEERREMPDTPPRAKPLCIDRCCLLVARRW